MAVTGNRPPQVRVDNYADFSGGLNLKAGNFGLKLNESPAMLNVDVTGTGGFKLRQGIVPLNTTALGAVVLSMFQFESSAGVKQIMAANTTATYFSTGGNFTLAFANTANTTRPAGAVFKDNLYVVRGTTDAVVKWTGTVATTLGVAFNDTITAPTGGNMPMSKHITAHTGRVWVAGTKEGATSYPNRVRWSHPNQPEDFRNADFIDIDTGADGDEIVGLFPSGDRLIVFKRNSIHAITGYDADTFQVFPLSRTLGAAGAGAITSTDVGIFFFHEDTGLHWLKMGGSIEYLWDNIVHFLQTGRLTSTSAAKVVLGYHRRRVYCSLPFDNAATNTVTLVCDLTLKNKPWVFYDTPIAAYLNWTPTQADDLFLGAHSTLPRVLKLQQFGVPTDDFGAGPTHISSYYNTVWYAQGEPALYKRYKRPNFVVQDDYAGSMVIQYYKDFNGYAAAGSFNVVLTPAGSNVTWGSVATAWNATTFGNGFWSLPGARRDTVKKGSNLGTALSVRFVINGPAENIEWGVHELALKYVRRRVR